MFGKSKEEKFFTEDEVNHLNHAMRFTPDEWVLCRRKCWWMFVYSRDQFGHPDVVQNSEYYPHTVYTTAPYSMWTKDLGDESFSIMMDTTNFAEVVSEPVEQPLTETNADGSKWVKYEGNRLKFRKSIQKIAPEFKVKGELVLVTRKMIHSLDEKYKNGVEYQRRRIGLQIPYRFQYRNAKFELKVSERQTELIHAFAYVGIQEFWDKQIGGSVEEVQLAAVMDGEKVIRPAETAIRHRSQGIFKPAPLYKPTDDFWWPFYHHDKLIYEK